MGHRFSNLPDLYISNNVLYIVDQNNQQTFYDDERDVYIPQCCLLSDGSPGDSNVDELLANLKSDWKNGLSWNVDIINDPSKVIWKDFIGKAGYNQVGVYETGWNVFAGLYRPEEFTAMSQRVFNFDVGSRYQAWVKAMTRSGLAQKDSSDKLNVQKFMTWDHEHGYDNDGMGTYHFDIPEILTNQYWKNNNLYP